MFIHRSILLALLAAVLAACGFVPETRSWTEDVQLDDGSVVTIERSVTLKSSNSWAGDAPSTIDKAAKLGFVGALSDLPVWNVPLMPLVLYQDAQTKEWVIVARTNRCDVWDARGQPFPPYWEYRLTNGQWRERPLSESSKGRLTNLLIEYRSRSLPSHVSIELKRSILADSAIGESYRRIVPGIRRHCMVNAK